MRGIGRALVGIEGLGVPHWVVVSLFFGTVILFLAYILQQAPLGRARGLINRSVHAPPAKRVQMEQEALRIVWDLPVGLLIVGQEALHRERRDLAHRVLLRLQELGQRPRDVRAFEDALYGRDRLRVEAERVAIRGFLEEGLYELAQPRLTRAQELWPDDPGLAELHTQLQRAMEREAEQHQAPEQRVGRGGGA
jgi:hypothetical protein